jgi:hypothetical protein
VFVPQHLFCLEVLQQPTAHKGAQDTFLQCGAYFGECDRSFRRIVTGGLSGDFSSVSVT